MSRLQKYSAQMLKSYKWLILKGEKKIVPVRQICIEFFWKWGKLEHTIISDPGDFPLMWSFYCMWSFYFGGTCFVSHKCFSKEAGIAFI